MSTIRNTIEDSMRDTGLASYIGQAEPVIAVLEDRERDIFRALIDEASAQGFNVPEVRHTLEAAGLTAPLAVVASGNGAPVLSEDERDELASVRHDLAGLMERIDKVLG